MPDPISKRLEVLKLKLDGEGRTEESVKSIVDNPRVRLEAARISEQTQQSGDTIKRFAKSPGTFTNDLQRLMASGFTRGGAERILSMMSGRSVEEERAETEAARARTGGAGAISEFVGAAAPLAALPSAAFSTVPRAMAMGGAIGAGENIAEAITGKEPFDAIETAGESIGAMAGAGVFSMAGRTIGRLWDEFVGDPSALPKQTQQALIQLRRVQNNASKEIDESGAFFRNTGLRRLSHRIKNNLRNNKRFAGLMDEAERAPFAHQALRDLDALIDQGDNVSFSLLNRLRADIRDLPFTRSGMLKEAASPKDVAMVRAIEDELNKHLQKAASLPNVLSAGDGKKAVAAWKKMNDATQAWKKSDLIAQMLDNAFLEAKKGARFDAVMQRQAQSLFKTPAGRRRLKQFDETERKILRDFAEGSTMTDFLNSMDDKLGRGTLLSTLYRMMRGPFASGAAGASEQAGRNLMTRTTGGIPVDFPTRVPGQAGAIAGTEIGAAAAGATPPGSGASTSNAATKQALKEGSRSIPQFPEAPGPAGGGRP